ncbi:MAG: sugar transferase [Actinomycetales bacterium]|nr:sugar transferase [Actinomycetales bacterium]
MSNELARKRAKVPSLAFRDALCILTAVTFGLTTQLGAHAALVEDRRRLFLAVSILFAWPAALWLKQSHQTTILGFGAEEYRRVLNATLMTFSLVCGAAYLASITRARAFVLFSALVGLALVLINRVSSRHLLLRNLKTSAPLHTVLLVGNATWLDEAQDVFDLSDGLYRVKSRYVVTSESLPTPIAVAAEARELGVDAIAISPTPAMGSTWVTELAWVLERSSITILAAASVVGFQDRQMSMVRVQHMNMLALNPPAHDHPALPIKRVIDVVGSGIGLILLSPILVVIAALIRLDSPGPALFKQKRMGQHNRTFTCWKFRTMRIGADAERATLRAQTDQVGATFKMQADPRVTRVGNTLRKYSLDELPQLVNVFKGEMSLVGPRPHPLDDVAKYSARDSRRLLAKPGMTGLWQVSGRSDLPWDAAVGLDLEYVESWSLSLDFLLLLRTVGVVFKGSGAY